jgi:ABC-type transporter Mla subunit MlaD
MADMTPTNKFIQTLSQTPGLATQLQGNLQKLQDDLDEIIEVLGYTKTVADDLDELVSALTTTSELLSVVAVIPEVGEAVTPVKEAVDALLAEVKPAKGAADKLEAMVKPFREALQKLDPVLDEMIKACGTISSTAQSFLNSFTSVTNCVNSLPSGQYKSDAQNYLNQFSSSVQPYVDALNTALRTANDAITSFYEALQALEDALSPLAALAQAIEAVTSTLQPLLDLLNQLNDALKSIKIPTLLPYPTEISLYDAFKYFGDLIDEAMKPIQGLVDDLLKALNIQLPSIPGLDQLYQLLNIQLPSIPDFSALLNAILQPFQQLQAWIAKFSLKCPPGPGDTVPQL